MGEGRRESWGEKEGGLHRLYNIDEDYEDIEYMEDDENWTLLRLTRLLLCYCQL